MPKAIKVSTNFTSGEVSPRLLGRTDLKKYDNGARLIENFLPQTHGGIERRPGTKYVADIYSSASTTYPPRLIEFQYNQDQSYVLEIGVTDVADEGYIRFFRLDATTGEPILLTDPTQGDIPTIKSGLNFAGADLAEMQFAQSADILYFFSENHPMQKLSRTSVDDDEATSWSYEKCVYKDGPYLPMNSDDDIFCSQQGGDGEAGTTVSFAFVDADASAVNNVLDPDDDVGRLIRIEDDSMGFPIVGFDPGTWDTVPDVAIWDPPAKITVGVDENGNNMYALLDTWGTSNEEGKRVEFLKITYGLPVLNDTVYVGRNFTTNLAESETTFELYHPDTGEGIGFSYLGADAINDDTDGVARFERSSHVGWGTITEVGSSGETCVVDLEDATPLLQGSRTRNFRLGAWSDSQGYPRTGHFYQNRLWSASSKTSAQTLWSSGTGAFNCYSPTTVKEGLVLDESAITVTLSDAQVNKINYLEGDTSGLIILTSGGEWLGRATNPQSPLTPTDLGFQKNSRFGSSATVQPLRADTSLIFTQRDGRVCRELTYEFGQDRFIAPNITLLSEHITKDGLIDSAYQSGVSSRLWFVRNDGVLLSMTYEKSEEVFGWAQHPLAPSTAGDAAEVKSVAVTLDDDVDNVWLLVKRQQGDPSNYVWQVEMVEKPLEAYQDHEYAFYVDNAVEGYDAAGASVWSGLEHLIGESVYVQGDGVEYGPYTVDVSGEIDMGDDSTKRAIIGRRYDSVMETLPLIVDPEQGNTRGKLKRIFKVMANLYRSLGGKLGTPEQVYSVPYPTATATELNTKMFEINMADNAQRETIVRFEQGSVHPANLLSIVSEFQIGQF